MRLSDLLIFREIVIQCHDHPDADTISSAYGLYLYYKNHGISVRMIYSGRDEIQKKNLQVLIHELEIPLEYVQTLNTTPDLLITVDCQYGEGNVTKFPAKQIAVIDHHQESKERSDYKEIRDYLGSCATLVYMMLLEDDYPVCQDQKLMTALSYGLYMDTNEFSEIRHPYDMDMIEELKPDEDLLQILKNCIFTFEELEIAGIALIRCTYSEQMHFAVVRSNRCDPNLLGFISDLVLQVEGVDTSVVFCEFDYGFRFSVRNCNPEATASEIINSIVQDMGKGGGHKNKAGGYVNRTRFLENYADNNFMAYLLNCLKTYFTNYDVIASDTEAIDLSGMAIYERLPIVYGMCKSTDLGELGQTIKIRTINKKLDIMVTENLYLLMNMHGTVLAVDKEQFECNYEMAEGQYECDPVYKPSVKLNYELQSVRLTDYLSCCRSINRFRILARKLTKTTKLYQDSSEKDYDLGEIGDYLVVKTEEDNKIAIIKRDQFIRNYKLIQES